MNFHNSNWSADTDELTLSSGRKIYCNNSIIGLTCYGELEIYEGYDGGIYDEKFTSEEKNELALLMMGRWAKWASEND